MAHSRPSGLYGSTTAMNPFVGGVGRQPAPLIPRPDGAGAVAQLREDFAGAEWLPESMRSSGLLRPVPNAVIAMTPESVHFLPGVPLGVDSSCCAAQFRRPVESRAQARPAISPCASTGDLGEDIQLTIWSNDLR